MESTELNEAFSIAGEVVNHTSCNLFLTGKAGTGKTTFLKYVCGQTHKNTVVVAPTGVAAINAGGVTIHSFFQLPLIPFLPEYKINSENLDFANRYSLFRGSRLRREKIDMLNELELLIIDEVSMVRSDVIDMIDEVLRHFRDKRNTPFGGVQVLFIGDMFQLPPVIKEKEWNTLGRFYATPFFFSAKVLEASPLLFLELKKVYRQNEEKFIHILNNIRNGACTKSDLDELNQHYSPDAGLKKKGITLVTHNYMADQINQVELQKLTTPVYKFNAEVKDSFPESSFPCETELNLKTGAQVMFIKNDSSGEKRYYNGKLATVKSIDEDKITVELYESKEVFQLEKEKWKNTQYKLNEETGRIEEEEIGSFTHYPVRLAWAVTVHKSQGLTFDEVSVDVGKSFAAGQVYVALSRCRTLKGINLLSPIDASHIITNRQILEFSQKENKLHDLIEILAEEKRKYAGTILIRAFGWRQIVRESGKFIEFIKENPFPDKVFAEEIVSAFLINVNGQNTIAEKFIAELEKKFSENPVNEQWLNKKVTGAKTFFIEKIQHELIAPLHSLQSYYKGKKKVRKLSKQVNELENLFYRKIKLIEQASFGTLAFEIAPVGQNNVSAPIKTGKQPAGWSKLESLNFYKQGMTAEQIAAQRGMAASTVEGHLAEFISIGEVNIYDFVDKALLEKIKTVVAKMGYERLTSIKNELGGEASYGQVRMAVNYFKGISAE